MFRELIEKNVPKADLNLMKDVYYNLSDAIYDVDRKLIYELDFLTKEEASNLKINPKKEQEILRKIKALFDKLDLGIKL